VITMTALLRDLFCLVHAHISAGGAGDGRSFERRIERHLSAIGVRQVGMFSGVRWLGSHSLSGLYHQIDATGMTREAIVIGEWKAYRGTIPKNDLIRFKAVTDDYWMRQQPLAPAPVVRVFGGTGIMPLGLRRYAALSGICLVTADRWPAPLLASETTSWPDSDPDRIARRHLPWLARPLDAVLAPQPDGSWSIPSHPADATIDNLLTLHDYWSDQLWQRFDRRPGSFSQWIQATVPWGVAA
jgi:hypothetical protein